MIPCVREVEKRFFSRIPWLTYKLIVDEHSWVYFTQQRRMCKKCGTKQLLVSHPPDWREGVRR